MSININLKLARGGAWEGGEPPPLKVDGRAGGGGEQEGLEHGGPAVHCTREHPGGLGTRTAGPGCFKVLGSEGRVLGNV